MANLRLPGPTPVPDDVVKAMSKPMIDHRGAEFAGILRRVTENLKKAFETKNDVFVLTSSGTGAMEAAVVNTLSVGEPVLAVSIGNFGDRFGKIAQTYGAKVTNLKFPEGEISDVAKIREALRKDPSITSVLVTHNETSTGITNDLEAISKVVKGEFDKLFLVDAISSLGSIRLAMDAWGIDVAASASQKGWACPPGLAMIAMSPRAWEAAKKANMPKFYFDLTEAKKSLEKGQTPWTPAVGLLYGLDHALRNMLAKGDMRATYDFHAEIAGYTRDRLRQLGLRLVAKDMKYASNTVTAAYLPDGVRDSALLNTLRDEYDIIAAEGRGVLAGKVFRIGHMGYVTKADIDDVIQALEKALPKLKQGAGAPAR
ncbi:MAG: alanine--glyoxylate aminotransferase family protein [SAR202 cluster bacterium]|nr:alanine--glyoxylate aminotransferase family protein [SAR202 cluster bacterium]